MSAVDPNRPGGTPGQPQAKRPVAAQPKPAAPKPGGQAPVAQPVINAQGASSAPVASLAPQINAGVAPMAPPARPVANRPQPVPAGGAVGANGRPIPVKRQAGAQSQEVPEEEESLEDRTLKAMLKNAPAWMISTAFHMIVLIALGLWWVTQPRKEDNQIEAVYAEELGEQMLDDSVLNAGVNQLEKVDQNIITPNNLPPVADPFAAPPEIPAIAVEGTMAVSSDKNAPMIGLALSGRQKGSKNQLLGKYGGNATTEKAVTMALQWLAKNQKADGSWSMQGPYADGGQDENVNSATAMALLAFQGAGNTHKTGDFQKNVVRGWDYLLKTQGKDGLFYQNGVPPHQTLYTQAQCMIAVCEMWGVTKDTKFRGPADSSVKYAVRTQERVDMANKTGGGWRYVPGSESDTSVTGWFVIGLQSAKMGGLEVPQETLENIMHYLDFAQEDDGRRYAYTPGTFVTPAVSAEGLLCREYLGWKQDDVRLIEGVRAVNQNPVNYNSADPDVYYWYYATQATHHMEGKIWDDWNKVMRQEVPAHQTQQGAEVGSWNPRGDKWGSYGGRLYVTCLSVYMLEVYYRHLPIYSGYKALK